VLRQLTVKVEELEEGPSAMVQSKGGRDRDDRGPRGDRDRGPREDRGPRGDRGGDRDDRFRSARAPRPEASSEGATE
jgi:small subunit ribosomal protein S6